MIIRLIVNCLLCMLAQCLWSGAAAAQNVVPHNVPLPAAVPGAVPVGLPAFVFEPVTAGRHPAVVMVHGCGGAYGKDGTLNARFQMWGEYLAAQGYVALMLDSFTARGLKQVCTTKFAERSIKEADRVADAYAALAYLRLLPQVDPARVALLGWSHGGGVTLNAISHRPPASPTTPPGFAAAISFYPGCTARNQKADSFHPYAPLLLLIGEADDWTPAAPCKALAATVAARGESMQIVAYPDTYHDFDSPALKAKHVRADVPNGVTPGAGVTTAPNPVAREDAKRRVTAFLAQHLQ